MKRIELEESGVRRAATFGEPAARARSLTALRAVVRLSATFALAAGCRSATTTVAPKGPEQAAVYEPSRALNGLFHDVLNASDTFVETVAGPWFARAGMD